MSSNTQAGGVPVLVLKEGSNRSRGKEAQHSNIAAAKIVAESVRSSLGPKGMDKMLVDNFGDVTITSDGRTILDEMDVQHPAAKMMVEVAKTQDNEAGDGTTSAVIIAGELLNKAEELLDKRGTDDRIIVVRAITRVFRIIGQNAHLCVSGFVRRTRQHTSGGTPTVGDVEQRANAVCQQAAGHQFNFPIAFEAKVIFGITRISPVLDLIISQDPIGSVDIRHGLIV